MVQVPIGQLPYPEKYEQALKFYENWPQGAAQASQDTQLILYGLSQQVAYGNCKDAKPSSWNALDTSKWTAWHGLQNMDKMEAMRLFVKTLEEDEPGWYGMMENGSSRGNGVSNSHALRSLPCDDTWRSPWVASDKHPFPRFEHSCCLLGNTMFLFGGNCTGGRYLSDVWQLNLETLAWTDVTNTYSVSSDPDDAAPAQFPPSATTTALPHRGRILLIGGHTKVKDASAPLTVRILDPARSTWSVMHCDGDVPRTRGSHASCIVGDKVYILNGEGPTRRMCTEVAVLDLASSTWMPLIVEGDASGPSPRSALVATAYQDRYVVTFGGGSVGQCHNDVWYLDTADSTWHQPPVSGPVPTARAGCCAALLGNRWYIFGGGNNAAGCPDMWMLDLLKLGMGSLEWEQVTTFDIRSSLASEGATVVAAPALGALVAFGGYNGTYHNAVSAFRPADLSHGELRGVEQRINKSTREPEIQPAQPRVPPLPAKQVLDVDPLEAAQKATAAALEDAAMAKEAKQQELALMRNQLSAAQAAQATAEAEVESLSSALTEEKDRAFKLEVEMSELRAKLQTMDELEVEVKKYKSMLAEREKKASGIWGYISGA